MDLETVWTGATWRTFPTVAPPDVSDRLAAANQSPRSSHATKARNRALILAACSSYRTTEAVAHVTGLSYAVCSVNLRWLWRQGQLERVPQTQCRMGRRIYLYRRRADV